MGLTMESVVALADSVLMADVDDGKVLLESISGEYASLDAVASHIVALLATPVDVATLCRRLVDRYAVDEATCRGDVLAFLDSLDAKGFLARR